MHMHVSVMNNFRISSHARGVLNFFEEEREIRKKFLTMYNLKLKFYHKIFIFLKVRLPVCMMKNITRDYDFLYEDFFY